MAPSKTQRDECNRQRMEYFACLDKHSLVSSRYRTVTDLSKNKQQFYRQFRPNSIPESQPDPVADIPECEKLSKKFREACDICILLLSYSYSIVR